MATLYLPSSSERVDERVEMNRWDSSMFKKESKLSEHCRNPEVFLM